MASAYSRCSQCEHDCLCGDRHPCVARSAIPNLAPCCSCLRAITVPSASAAVCLTVPSGNIAHFSIAIALTIVIAFLHFTVRVRSMRVLEETKERAEQQNQRLQNLVEELQDTKQKAVSANAAKSDFLVCSRFAVDFCTLPCRALTHVAVPVSRRPT